MTSILVFIDQFKGAALAASWETLGAAKKRAADMGGATVTALVLGHNAENVAKESFEYGADAAMLCDDATLADFRVRPYSALIVKPYKEATQKPAVILARLPRAGATVTSGDVFNRVHTGGDWIQIKHPAASNGIAWVLASLVQVSMPVDQLPTASP